MTDHVDVVRKRKTMSDRQFRELYSWKPIETAPKDTYVYVYHPDWKWRGLGGCAIGYCHSDFNGHKDVWTLDGRAGVIMLETPTQWAPLLPPPTATEN